MLRGAARYRNEETAALTLSQAFLAHPLTVGRP